jgi:TonB family protein
VKSRKATLPAVTVLLLILVGRTAAVRALDVSAESKTCSDIGFKPKTEAFGKCVLELLNRDKQQQVPQTQLPTKSFTSAPPVVPQKQETVVPSTGQTASEANSGQANISVRLRPIMNTHTVAPYPPESFSKNEKGTVVMRLYLTTLGNVDRCQIVTTSGYQRLDTAACNHVKEHWLWEPPPVAGFTHVSMKFDLKYQNASGSESIAPFLATP